uniref:Peptidase S1 domain-containing protein n=1 Tax=Biomphalaria glabrata TaxID=6526 RepID=A0A2C9LKE2_BIOGL
MVNLFGPPNEFEQVLRVDKFDMHDGSYITNDIAVITMATPAKLNKNVKVAVLAEKDSNYVRENCTISGWGRTNVEVFNQTNSLQKAMTSIVSTEECMQRWTRLNTVLSEGTVLCVLDET